MLIEHSSQLDERAAARPAVIRADEANRVESFRVVMRANEIELLARGWSGRRAIRLTN